ncbi:MAG: class I SAM-dependent methyltransferase [Rhodoblastus sp.]
MNDDFAARRAAARKRLDAIDPAKAGKLDDPYRRDWFRAVYDTAQGDEAAVPWADKAAHPLLAEWLAHPSPLWGGAGGVGRAISAENPGGAISQDSATPHSNPPPQGGREQTRPLANLRALDVGCGLGDNAEALAAAGAKTTAFDLSENAIRWAKRRFPGTAVDYRAADLFDPPADWPGAFDLVHECYTLQALPNRLLPQAGAALASFLKPGGRLLVIARSRPNPAAPDGPPWPLSRGDIEGLVANGLTLESLEELAPPGEPAHWRALYRRAA